MKMKLTDKYKAGQVVIDTKFSKLTGEITKVTQRQITVKFSKMTGKFTGEVELEIVS